MGLRVCACGRHVRATDERCPFCGASSRSAPALRDELRGLTAIVFGTAAVCAACGARTELGAHGELTDASAPHDASAPDDASLQDHASDAPADGPDVADAPTDVLDDAPCVPVGGVCATSADCCDPNVAACFDGRCVVPLYGAPPPPK
jgi:hypothetical protein